MAHFIWTQENWIKEIVSMSHFIRHRFCIESQQVLSIECIMRSESWIVAITVKEGGRWQITLSFVFQLKQFDALTIPVVNSSWSSTWKQWKIALQHMKLVAFIPTLRKISISILPWGNSQVEKHNLDLRDGIVDDSRHNSSIWNCCPQIFQDSLNFNLHMNFKLRVDFNLKTYLDRTKQDEGSIPRELTSEDDVDSIYLWDARSDGVRCCSWDQMRSRLIRSDAKSSSRALTVIQPSLKKDEIGKMTKHWRLLTISDESLENLPEMNPISSQPLKDYRPLLRCAKWSRSDDIHVNWMEH